MTTIYDLDLRHYDFEPFEYDPKVVYLEVDRNNLKPNGLWVSVHGPDDWPTWCRGEDFMIDHLDTEYSVRLSPSANIRFIQGLDEFDEFQAQYGYSIGGDTRLGYIDWNSVRRDYDGVIIAPYLWSRRMDGGIWYYGWDCASGCIWNLAAIDSLTLIEKEGQRALGS